MQPSKPTYGTGSATDTSATQVIAAPGANKRLFISSIIVSNSSATASEVTLKDGTTTIMVIPAPADSGAVLNLHVHLKLSENTALNFTSADSVTTMKVSAVGYIKQATVGRGD